MVTTTNGSVSVTDTETTIKEDTTEGYHALHTFTHNMIAGDEFEFIIYIDDPNTGNTYRKFLTINLVGVQDEPDSYIPPILANKFKVTGRRVAGANRIMTWYHGRS